MQAFKTLQKYLTFFFLTGLLSACGGNNIPSYGDGTPVQPSRVNGELAFSSPSMMKMAESFRISGDYTNAIRLYQRAANENQKHIPSRLALGQIYQRLGATDGAIVYYKQVLDLDPDNTDAQLGLGQMMVKNNQPLEAITYLEQVAEKSPDNFRIYNSIGLAYDLEGMHEEAQFAYGKGLNIEPNHISLLNNLALSLAIDGEFAPAIQLLSKAINLDYSQTTAQQNLIMVYALSGEESAARDMASSFMTPEEIESNIIHYRWLNSLSSKRRAQAIFLNLKSFPDEEVVEKPETIDLAPQSPLAENTENLDPKKQMLMDILNSEDQNIPPRNDIIDEPQDTVSDRIAAEEAMPQLNIPETNSFYRLQLGSHPTPDDVMTDWKRLQKLAPELLADAEIDVQQITTADNTSRFRLFTGNYTNYSAAEEFCQALQEKQVSCLVLKSSRTIN